MTVVAAIHKSLPVFSAAVPEDITITYAFDESPTVVAAIHSVATEGVIGAVLTGLMILIFLRDLRSVVVVVLNIPLALTGSLVGLWLTGNTINIMSLGGMALAIGMLVDEATVSIENIHVQMGQHAAAGPSRRARKHADRRAPPVGDDVHSVGVHSGVHHGRPDAGPVHAAGAGGRLCHDLVLSAVEHAGADRLRVAAQASAGAGGRSVLIASRPHSKAWSDSPCGTAG